MITDVRYVFSTPQYLATYKGPRSEILKTIYERCLANPVHVALYVGRSFADGAMNGLLRDAFTEYPGRYRYALLKWPGDRKGREPSAGRAGGEECCPGKGRQARADPGDDGVGGVGFAHQ